MVRASPLKVLARTAEQARVKAMYYVGKGTPDAAVKLAQKRPAKENVVVFERQPSTTGPTSCGNLLGDASDPPHYAACRRR